MKNFRFFTLLAFLPLLAAKAQTPEDSPYWSIIPNSYCCLKAAAPITVDGVMDEADWQRAPWTEDFVDIEGPARDGPRYRTRVKMLWDATHFYVYAELDDPHVWGRLRQRDTVIFHDNDFEIFICPTGTNHTYYELEVNALNTVWDLFLLKPYRDGGPADNGWDIEGLRTAVFVRGTLNDPTDVDDGWNVEVAIPWAAFNRTAMWFDGQKSPMAPTPPVPGQDMRVNFSRVQWRHDAGGGFYRKIEGMKEDNWVWSPQGVIDMHRPEKWGWVYFMDSATDCEDVGPDPDYVFHIALMRVYDAQKRHFQRRKRHAKTLDDLVLPPHLLTVNGARLDLRMRDNGYVASYRLRRPNGSRAIISMDELSQLLTFEVSEK
jgi:hypothetical protein